MARNKYAKDYRLIETVDARGRIHTDYEYIGAHYYFRQSPPQVRRELKLRTALCAAGWLSFLGAMLPNSQAMRTMYISLPFVFTAVPMALVTLTLLSLWRAPQPMEHRYADKLDNRYPPASLAWTLLSASSVVGQCVRTLTSGGSGGGDAVFALCAFCCAVCGALCFLRRRHLSAGTKEGEQMQSGQ